MGRGTRDLLGRAAVAVNGWTERYLPSALGIAVVLTFLTFALACAFGFREGNPGVADRLVRCLASWGEGLSGLLSFAMQMCLVMLCGYVVAVSPPFRRILDALAGVPRGPRSAVAWMAFLSMTLGLLNWGVSIVGGAVLARAIARRRRDVDYRLLVAAAYLGLGCTWHAGLSASAPMTVAAAQNDFVRAGYLPAPVPAAATVGSSFNVGLTAVVLVVMTGLTALLHPRREDTFVVDPSLLEEPDDGGEQPAGPVDRSRLVVWLLAAGCAVYLVDAFAKKGLAALNINAVNAAFLGLGLALHGSLASFGRAAARGASYLHGIVIQFPLYAGMGAVIKDSGLAARVADMLVTHASARWMPLLVYWYSGLVNYFVPSGGSKFAIEAPYLFPAAAGLGVAPSTVVLAYAWGDMMTDVIQPFWAIPLLGVARLDFRAIAGYCAVLFVAYAALVSLAFAVALPG
jgi:short-chain fatty acids transporter